MIALRACLQRQRRRLLVVAGLVALSVVLVWAHSGGESHVAEEGLAAQAISICLAVLQGAVGILLGGLALSLFRRRRAPRIRPAGPVGFVHVSRLTAIRSRAGPPVLQVFLR